MGNCNTNKNSKHNDYHGGIQRSEPSDIKIKKVNFKRTNSLKEVSNLYNSKPDSLHRVATGERGSSSKRSGRESKKMSMWASGNKSTDLLSDPAKVLFDE